MKMTIPMIKTRNGPSHQLFQTREPKLATSNQYQSVNVPIATTIDPQMKPGMNPNLMTKPNNFVHVSSAHAWSSWSPRLS